MQATFHNRWGAGAAAGRRSSGSRPCPQARFPRLIAPSPYLICLTVARAEQATVPRATRGRSWPAEMPPVAESLLSFSRPFCSTAVPPVATS